MVARLCALCAFRAVTSRRHLIASRHSVSTLPSKVPTNGTATTYCCCDSCQNVPCPCSLLTKGYLKLLTSAVLTSLHRVVLTLAVCSHCTHTQVNVKRGAAYPPPSKHLTRKASFTHPESQPAPAPHIALCLWSPALQPTTTTSNIREHHHRLRCPLPAHVTSVPASQPASQPAFLRGILCIYKR